MVQNPAPKDGMKENEKEEEVFVEGNDGDASGRNSVSVAVTEGGSKVNSKVQVSMVRL